MRHNDQTGFGSSVALLTTLVTLIVMTVPATAQVDEGTGSITVRKVVHESKHLVTPPADSFHFTLDGGDSVNLLAGEEHTWTGLPAGEYTVSEVLTEAQTADGWAIEWIECTTDPYLHSPTSGDATFELASGQEVLCSFENFHEVEGMHSELTVRKAANDLAPNAFFSVSIDALDPANDFFVDSELSPYGWATWGFEPGPYRVTETISPEQSAEGWLYQRSSCGFTTIAGIDLGFEVELRPGERADCTLTNLFPMLDVEPSGATAGAQFAVAGTGFTPNGTIDLAVQDSENNVVFTDAVTTDHRGDWTATLDTTGWVQDTYRAVASEPERGLSRSDTFVVVEASFDFALDRLLVDGNLLNSGGPDGSFEFVDEFDDGSLDLFPSSEIHCIGDPEAVTENGGFLQLNSYDGANTFSPGFLVDNCQLGGSGPESAYRFADGSGDFEVTAWFRADIPQGPTNYGIQLFHVGTSDNVNIQITNCGPDAACAVAGSTYPTLETRQIPVDLASTETVGLRLFFDDATNEVTPSISLDGGGEFIEVLPAHRTIFDDGSGDAITSAFGSVIYGPQSRPEIEITPEAGPIGTSFAVFGSGFTTNSTVTSHLERPDGTEFDVLALSTDDRGTYTHTINSAGLAAGNYDYWVVDDVTGVRSPTASFLVADIPDPDLVQVGYESYSNDAGDWVTYLLSIANYGQYPTWLFEEAPDLPPCGLNTEASRTWINIYDAEDDSRLYGFCAIDHPQDLLDLSFTVPAETVPPSSVYVTLWDRRTGIRFISNAVPILRPEITITPEFGPAGTQFSVVGTGLTANSTVTSHLKRPDGTEFGTLKFATDSTGGYTHTINSDGFSAGTFEHWVVDDSTGVIAPAATFRVTVPTSFVDPQEGKAGTQFTLSGEGFSPNATVKSHLLKPNDIEFPVMTFVTDGLGSYSHVVDSSKFPPGTYSHWADDSQTGTSSDPDTFEVTVGTGDTPQPPRHPSRQPVIIVPGIGGSWPGEELRFLRNCPGLNPITHIGLRTGFKPVHDPIGGTGSWYIAKDTYEPWEAALTSEGYRLGRDLFYMPFWGLERIDKAAPRLQSLIDYAMDRAGASSVDIVAHSQGGILARTYLARYGSDDVDQLLTFGTPHHGAPVLYPLWEAGETDYLGGLLEEVMEDYLACRTSGIFKGEDPSEIFEYLHNGAPVSPDPSISDDLPDRAGSGVLGLLPTGTYLRDVGRGTDRSRPCTSEVNYPVNHQLCRLFSEDAISALEEVRLTVTVGHSHPTASRWFVWTVPELFPRWEHGYTNPDFPEHDSGDGRVPLWSATLATDVDDVSDKECATSFNHSQLAKQSGFLVVDLLDDNQLDLLSSGLATCTSYG